MLNKYQKIVFKATRSERAERYAEMVEYVKCAIKCAHEDEIPLDDKMLNLFSVAYKNFVGMRRSAWRVLCAEKNKYGNYNPEKAGIVDEEILMVENELMSICEEVLKLIKEYVLVRNDVVTNTKNHVFFIKMIGDYCRYEAEVARGENLDKCIDQASNAYTKAYNMAMNLEPTSSTRLGCALNFSVFKYEIMSQTNEACEMAKEAFGCAIENINNLSESDYKDTTLIMQLLRDNLTLWTTKPEEEENEE